MAKPTIGLSTDRKVENGILKIGVKAVSYAYGDDGKLAETKPLGPEFSREVNLPELFGDGWNSLTEIGQSAAEFGAWTCLRNSTAGSTLEEAETRMDAVLAAWQEGEWTAKRASGLGSGVPFPSGSDWVAALVEVYPQHFSDKVAAAKWLNAQIDETAWKGFTDEQKAEARKLVRSKIAQDQKVANAREAIAAARRQAKAKPAVDKPLFS